MVGGNSSFLHPESPRRPVSSSLVNTNEPTDLFLCSPVLFSFESHSVVSDFVTPWTDYTVHGIL